jgi:hypothetical protein
VDKDRVQDLMEAGYFVYPVTVELDEKGKKRPVMPGSWKDSTREYKAIDLGFWARHTGLVIDCEKSGIVVIDLDMANGKDALTSLAEAGIKVPKSPMNVKTWSGGYHGFFRQPWGRALDSSQGVPVKDVDIRGLGGIVFGPGTEVHDSEGNMLGAYLANQIVRVEDLPVLPSEFVSAVLEASAPKDYTNSRLEEFTGELTAWQRGQLEGWYESDLLALGEAGPGERHRALLQNVGKILDRGLKIGLDQDTIIVDIQEAYEDSGGTEWEDKAQIIEWSIARLQEKPMGVPVEPTDPEGLEYEARVKEELRKMEIRAEAQRRFKVGFEPVDTGRELDFNEPEGSLYGESWVKRVLPKGETVILFGERYHGKSVFGLDLGLSVASGHDWHGHKVQQGNVLYLAGEGTIGLPARRRAWVEHNGLDNPGAFTMRDRVVQLGNMSSVKAFQGLILEHEIDLVIVDTLKRAARGLDIADPGVAQDMVEVLDDLRRVRHGCTALVLHHPTKSNPTEPAGGGTLQDAVSVIHHLVKDAYGSMTLTTTKMKDGPDGVVGDFHLIEVGSSVALTQAGARDTIRETREEEEF